MTDPILAPGYRLRSESTMTVREATRHTPRDDAEFVVDELLAAPDESPETTLDDWSAP